MKKSRKVIICASLAIVLIIGMYKGRLEAEEARISSNGNFVFESGEKEASFYAEDVTYLQKEIVALFNELEGQENE